MNKFLIAAVCLLSFVLTAVWMWPEPAPSDSSAGLSTPSDHVPAPFPVATLSSTPSSPASRSETGPAGLEILPDGRLKVAPSIKAPLDRYLTAHRHQSLEELVEGFKQSVASELEEPAATEAVELMTRYAAYQLTLQEAQLQAAPLAQSQDEAAAIIQLQRTHALREQFLGPELSQALYGDDQQQQRYLMARSQILGQTGLNAQERGEELAALRRQYPPSVVESVEKLTHPR